MSTRTCVQYISTTSVPPHFSPPHSKPGARRASPSHLVARRMAWPLLCSLASLALALRSRLPASPRMAAAPLVVPASAFASELAYRTVTASTFAGAPLASHDAGTRGKVLTGYARRCDADEHPGAVIEDAVAGEAVDGRRLAQHNAAYDWQRDGRRVAGKGSQLVWDDSFQRWKLQFQNVKLGGEGEEAAFDELLCQARTSCAL